MQTFVSRRTSPVLPPGHSWWTPAARPLWHKGVVGPTEVERSAPCRMWDLPTDVSAPFRGGHPGAHSDHPMASWLTPTLREAPGNLDLVLPMQCSEASIWHRHHPPPYCWQGGKPVKKGLPMSVLLALQAQVVATDKGTLIDGPKPCSS